MCCCTPVSDKGQRIVTRMFSKGLSFVREGEGWSSESASETHGL